MPETSTQLANGQLSDRDSTMTTGSAQHQEPDTIVMDRAVRPVRRSPSPITRIGGAFTNGLGIWLGLAVGAVGFAAIVFAWAKVAGLVNVALQVPYLISGGLAGLALVIVGMTVIDVSVRRQDGHERRQQLAQMTSVLAELRESGETERYDEDREPR